MAFRRFTFILLIASIAASCSSPSGEGSASRAEASSTAAAPTERKYLLERVDDAAVVQLYADGFSSLPVREKTLIWHLYQAALAGRDIYIDQKHRDALEMRGVVEQIVAHPPGVDPAALRAIQRYTKLSWTNNGPYNNLTAREFLLALVPPQLRGADKSASSAGGTFATRPGESVDQMLGRLGPMFFDANVDPIVTNKTPGPGKDILTASANNLYSGVAMSDVKGFNER